MDMLPSEYIKVRVSKKLKKIEQNFEKILKFFFED